MPRLVFAWLAAAAFAASLGFFAYSYLVVYAPVSNPSADPWSPPAVPWLVNLALFSVFALHHSVFARSGIKRFVHAVVAPPMERAVYSMVASVLFVLVCWLWSPIEGIAWTLPGAWRWFGIAIQATGVVMTLAGARALDVLELAGVRQVLTTAPRPAVLKTDGVYGFVRHPLYFSWVLLVFGAPEMSLTRLSFAAISTVYLALAIPFEERGLIETFGPDYASYRKSVRWRMLPGIY